MYFTVGSVSLLVVATIKKNKSMNTISGNEAVFIAGADLSSTFLNLDMALVFRSYLYNSRRI